MCGCDCDDLGLPIGARGATGATGATGAQGIQGDIGLTGDPGVAGDNGVGYELTSAESFSVPAVGATVAFVVNLDASISAYTAGARVRVSDQAAPTTNFFEGVVSVYSTTNMTVVVDYSEGSGTPSNWNINIAGIPGEVITSNWIDYEYNASYLDATSGTWTLSGGAPDFIVKYKIEGKTCYIDFRIVNGTLSSDPTSLKLTLPSGVVPVAGHQWNSIGYYQDGNNTSTKGATRLEIDAGDARLFISNLTDLVDNNFQAIVGGLDVLGQIFFEIE